MAGQMRWRFVTWVMRGPFVVRGLGNGGEYFYFLCRVRQDGHCDQRYVPVDVMEDAVVKHYATEAWMPTEVRQTVCTGAEAAVASHQGLSDGLRASLETQLTKGQRKESYFIDLAAEEEWPKDVLREKVQAIRDERARIRRQLDDSSSQLEAGRQGSRVPLTCLTTQLACTRSAPRRSRPS
jgi:hypothetical protein